MFVKSLNYYLLLVILANGFIWTRSSYGKLVSGKFVDGLGGTLTKFASNNPYPWYKDFLQNFAIPNSQIFGQLTMWGEVLVALSLAGGALYLMLTKKFNTAVAALLVLGLAGGMFLNGMFWLASGWTSPSSDSVNLLMFVVQLVGLAYVLRLLRS